MLLQMKSQKVDQMSHCKYSVFTSFYTLFIYTSLFAQLSVSYFNLE